MSARRWFTWILAFWVLAAAAATVHGQTAPIPASSKEKSVRHAQDAQWFLRGRVTVRQSAAALRYRAYRQNLAARAAGQAAARQATANIAPRTAPASGWTGLGPAPLASDASGIGQQDYGWVSGRATAVVIDRADPSGNTVYIGGADGGLWKSTNAASSNPGAVVWTPVTDNQLTLSVGAIAIQPQLANLDPTKSVVLAGTGETNSSTDSYYGLGILRSANAGQTWTLIKQDATGTHSFKGIGFSQIAFSANDPSLVVAAAAGTSQGELEGLENPQAANLGLYESADGGVTWNAATVMDGAASVAPESATSVIYNAAAGEFFAALRFHGFYSSSDGLHWSRLANQPGGGLSSSACPATPVQSTCPIYRGEVAVVSGRNEIYAWYVDSNAADQGIWRSVDVGTTWTRIDETGINDCGDLIGGCGTDDGTYNLTLAAVPDGLTGTDLYAGAVNLFKCAISQTYPNCNPNATPAPAATFLNLTHVYGCPPDLGSIARVHPSQHAMDALTINAGAQVVMYFANDGGIYRARDGYSGLTSGSCGTPNQFDSLNQTLGSMTQFVSLAQHPSDANTMLGGTQGNGSPATAAALSSGSWNSVNSADGGYSEINPDNPSEWFTANTGVSIQRCGMGIGCHAQDFNDDLVVSNSTVGGDGSGLYAPFMLDPQNSGELIVGTCRIWRGSTSGVGFSALSNNFDTGGSEACTGDEVNVVRSLGAGGAIDSNQLSNVIYAGTDGLGPFAAQTTTGGRIWVSTNAGGGAASWADLTGTINPSGFPVSGIAVDHSDGTGNTAYVTIMGFQGGHVWQTRNAGLSWTNFTANLSNAPANAILVDSGTSPTTGTVYVATDVGVFSSPTSGAGWTEVGPNPLTATVTGFLPDVPVTALRLFNNGITKLLRAATYGRGVWQFPLTTTPDFQIAFPNPSHTVFASQTASYRGILNSFNGYSSAVTLNCAAGSTPPPPQCAAMAVMPSASGTDFTLTASAPAGNYSFLVTGVGPGAGANATPITHSVALTLQVLDFTLSPPSPAAMTVQTGQTSGPIAMQVGFSSSFPANGTIELSCGSPPGVSCNFFPSATVSASQGSTAPITMTVTASPSAPDGIFAVSISATSSTADPATLGQTLQLTIISAGYSLAVQSPSAAIAAGQSVVLGGSAAAVNGYSSVVSLSCATAATGGAAPSNCVFTPRAVTPLAGGAAFQLMVGSTSAGSFAFTVHGEGADGVVADTPVSLNVYDFSIGASTVAPVPAGQTATYTLTFTPLPRGMTFQATVNNFTCSGLPALTSCSFGASQISAGSGVATVMLMIRTTAAVASLRRPSQRSAPPFYVAFLPVSGMALALTGIRARGKIGKNRTRAFVLALAIGALLTVAQFGCGGGSLTGGSQGAPPVAEPGTIPSSYPVTVSAAEGSLTRATTATLTVQ